MHGLRVLHKTQTRAIHFNLPERKMVMGKYLFNPFTQNFTIIPKPAKPGFFTLSARDGKLEWLVQKDPNMKTVTIDFSSTAIQYVSSAGILPRVQIARADASYLKNITDPNLHSHEVLLEPGSNTSTFSVGVFLDPDQGAVIRMLPSVAINVFPVPDSAGNNVAFLYLMTFDTDSTVNISVYDVAPPPSDTLAP